MSTNLDLSEFDGLFDDISPNTTLEAAKASLASENGVTAQPVAENEGIEIAHVNAPINPAVLQSAQAKMQQIFIEMNNLFVERDELIKLMELAVVTGTNLLMLGPPGTARVDIIA